VPLAAGNTAGGAAAIWGSRHLHCREDKVQVNKQQQQQQQLVFLLPSHRRALHRTACCMDAAAVIQLATRLHNKAQELIV
jgi:hypothetical protein